MSAVFLDYETVSGGDLDTSALLGAVPDLRFFGSTAPADITGRIADANIVLVNKCRLPGECLREAPGLRLIALAATGTDNVDLVTARELGIAVCNVRSYCTASVVQHVWGMILALTHHLFEYRALATGGAWRRGARFTMLDHPFRELKGRRLGIVGYGELGRGVAQAAQAFGMQVDIANRPDADPRPGRLDLAELLRVADVVSLHCPLNEATRGLIGGRETRPHETGRAAHQHRARCADRRPRSGRRIAAGRLGGAGIDVLPEEPPVNGDPLLDPDIPNLLSRRTSPGRRAKHDSAALRNGRQHPGFSGRQTARTGRVTPAGRTLSASVLLLFAFGGALFFQRLCRLLFFFFLSLHALAHDSLLLATQRPIRACPLRHRPRANYAPPPCGSRYRCSWWPATGAAPRV